MRSIPGTAPPPPVSASPRNPTKRERRNQAKEMLPPRTATPKPASSGNAVAENDARDTKERKETAGRGGKVNRTPKMPKEELLVSGINKFCVSR